MKKIIIPSSFNYISAFITFACNFKCSYCINKYNGLHKYKSMSTADWIKGINRIKTQRDLPVTITGGEPTIHKGFYDLIRGIDKKIPLDLLTNGDFSITSFMRHIPPDRMKRDAKYASIRFSYHPGYTDTLLLLCNVRTMQTAGYSVGVWAVDTGEQLVEKAAIMAKVFGIDFRLKEFLDATHGNYKYPKGVDGVPKKALCRGSEFLIAPNGELFRCHYDLYHAVNSYGHILDDEVNLPTDFLPCSNFGLCSPCDQKIKFDRFQRNGHCAVVVKVEKEKK